MMAESDTNILQASNGNEDDDTSEPPVLVQKSLFGNSASLLRQGQMDELGEEVKQDSSRENIMDAKSFNEHSNITEPDNNSSTENFEDEKDEQTNDSKDSDDRMDDHGTSNGLDQQEEVAKQTEELPGRSLADELVDAGEIDEEPKDAETTKNDTTNDIDLSEVQDDQKEITEDQEEVMQIDSPKTDSPEAPAQDEQLQRTPSVEAEPAKQPESGTVSGRRSLRVKDDAKSATPVTAPKSSTRGTKKVKNEEVAEASTVTPKTTRGRKSVKNDESVEEKSEEKTDEEAIPSKAADTRSTRKNRAEAKEEPISTPRTLRKRPSTANDVKTPAATPKGRGNTALKTSSTNTKKHEEEVAVKESPATTQTRTPKNSRKSAAAPEKASTKEKGQDPFDFDEMSDNHPEPLKNIQVEVQSFGSARFSKVGSGKYSNTEKAAEGRVGIVTPTTPEKTPKMSLMDLMKKEAEIASQATPRSAPNRRARKNDDEEMEIETTTSKRTLSKSAPSKEPVKKGRKRRSSPLATTPKKAKVEVPVLTPEQQLTVDLPDNDDAQPGILPGARVFALYDKVFYPARVSSLNGFGRVQVYFIEDELTKELPESAVIPIALLSSDRLAVIQTETADIRATIIEPPSRDNWFEGKFHLRSIPDSEDPNVAPKDFYVEWDKLILDMEDWKDYVRSKDAHVTDVKKTNIEVNEVKVTRSTRHSAVTPTSAAKTLSKPTPKRTPAAPVEKTPKADVTKEKAVASNKKIFAGYSFLLTSANRQLAENQIPFKKNELKTRIQQRGGTIIESVSEAIDGPSFLISDTYYRTQKYLAALACDMPCVSHEWVLQCVKEEKFLDTSDFVLPAGMSIVDEQIHNCKALKGRLLKGKRVCIYSLQEKIGSNLTFCEIWEPIARMLGADLIDFESAFDDQIDYFITDPTCSAETAKEAIDHGAMVLSSEWLIQTIIMGSPQPQDGHPRFAYNFSGTQA